MNTIKLGILGFGTVGRGTAEILKTNSKLIEKRINCKIEILKIYDRHHNKIIEGGFKKENIAENLDDILKNPQIDIIVEALGGIEPASEYILTALENGKHVVTANKAAVAKYYEKFKETAEKNDVELKFEACVGGGIPVLTSINKALAANDFTEIKGIVNGTTNYILTQMTENKLSYTEALKSAQKKGFAEADPTADVEGIDAANKLTILMALAFNRYISPDLISRSGITKITPEDIEIAKNENCIIKLIASARKKDKDIICSVKPEKIDKNHPLAGVSNEFNAIYLKGNAVGEIMFYGKGAGALPTGSAVVGDVLSIIEKMKK